jgi:flagellar biosynthesis/type III secretory pathway ATPase
MTNLKRAGLLTLNQFRETALGDMKGEISSDTNKEVADEILELLKDFDENFRILFVSTIHEGRKQQSFLDALKKMTSLLKTLKQLPDERKKDGEKDPLSNTVARPHDGPDGPDGAGNGG